MTGRSPFRGLETLLPTPGEYRFLPFRFMRWHTGEVLLVNDVGESSFLDPDTFGQLCRRQLRPLDSAYLELKAKHMISDAASTVPLELLATKYRTKKSFLEGFTKLHLFVVTLRCDHTCRYCQVSRVTTNRDRYDMNEGTAARAIDLLFRSPSRHLKVEFQGGESLLNFELIRWIIERVEQRNATEQRAIEFVIATNLAPLTDDVLDFCREHEVLLSTSLDGPAFVHNANRPRPGNDSYEITVRNLCRAREALGHDRVSAIMTTTARSLEYPVEIVDEYVALGFDSIFLRPISPYGFAVRTREAYRYEMAEYLEFYRRGLARVIEVNRAGGSLVEVYAQILLTKILTPFATGYVDLQSPSGAVIGAVVYNYDGDVYASDESRMLAEMGDRSFRLGNVHRDSFEEIFGGEVAQALVASSIQELLPGCAECAFVPYCGADPVFHHRTQGDVMGHRPTSAFCTKNMAVITHLFDLLRGEDHYVRDLLTSWATLVRPEVVARDTAA